MIARAMHVQCIQRLLSRERVDLVASGAQKTVQVRLFQLIQQLVTNSILINRVWTEGLYFTLW